MPAWAIIAVPEAVFVSICGMGSTERNSRFTEDEVKLYALSILLWGIACSAEEGLVFSSTLGCGVLFWNACRWSHSTWWSVESNTVVVKDLEEQEDKVVFDYECLPTLPWWIFCGAIACILAICKVDYCKMSVPVIYRPITFELFALTLRSRTSWRAPEHPKLLTSFIHQQIRPQHFYGKLENRDHGRKCHPWSMNVLPYFNVTNVIYGQQPGTSCR